VSESQSHGHSARRARFPETSPASPRSLHRCSRTATAPSVTSSRRGTDYSVDRAAAADSGVHDVGWQRTLRQACRCGERCNRKAFLRMSGLKDEQLIYDAASNAAGQSARLFGRSSCVMTASSVQHLQQGLWTSLRE
jgi:hypothetical protein